MPLAVLNGRLLIVNGTLAEQCSCCANPPPPPTGYTCADESCVPVYGGPGQYTTLEECRRYCEGECSQDSDCGECSVCVDGECQPCPQGTTCVNGVCREPCTSDSQCGECEVCLDGQCQPCPEGTICVGGICEPDPCDGGTIYYCCWKNALKLELVCQQTPCGPGLQNGDPKCTQQECDETCSKYRCNQNDGYRCIPDKEGAYSSIESCRKLCKPPGCAGGCPPPQEVESTAAFYSTIVSAPFGAATIKVEYDAFSVPDRFQIWGPTIQGGQQVADRVIKADSGYRGDQQVADQRCDDKITVKGGGSGSIQWNKPEGVCAVEVVVIAPCKGTRWNIKISCEANAAP